MASTRKSKVGQLAKRMQQVEPPQAGNVKPPKDAKPIMDVKVMAVPKKGKKGCKGC